MHPPSLIRVFAVRMKKAWVLSYPLSAQRKLWSDWADAQADLSLHWAHSHFVGFVMRRLNYNCVTIANMIRHASRRWRKWSSVPIFWSRQNFAKLLLFFNSEPHSLYQTFEFLYLFNKQPQLSFILIFCNYKFVKKHILKKALFIIWAATWQNQQNECAPSKTQISLGIHPVWSESLLSAWRKLGSLVTHWVHSKDSDQTGQMPRLIWIFAGHTLILLVLSCHGSFSKKQKNLPQHYTTGSVSEEDLCVTLSTWRRRDTWLFHWWDEWQLAQLDLIFRTWLPRQPVIKAITW